MDRHGRSPRLARSGRLANPRTATAAGLLSLLFLVAIVPLQIADPGASLPTGGAVVEVITWFIFGVTFTAVGTIVARHQPQNPMGWLLLAMALAINVGSVAPAYAWIDYHGHHGKLPLGSLAVLLSGLWVLGFIALPLVILLFPDAQIGRRWRLVVRAYLLIAAATGVGVLVIAVRDLSLRLPVDVNGNLVGLQNPTGWLGVLWKLGFSSCLLLALLAVGRQIREFRRARGVRRRQLKWLCVGAGVCSVCTAVSILWSSAPGVVNAVLFPIALSALPLAMGVGILKYRLYEIDRLISRTLSYALLTALLVGTFVGLVALTTNTLALSGRVGVAASTLVAAALFSPLRIRLQRIVDRRFNRARYDAEATVAAFNARLRDAVEIDAIRTDLLDALTRAVQPTHASVWIKP